MAYDYVDPGGYDGPGGGWTGDPGTSPEYPWEGWEEEDWFTMAWNTVSDWLGFGENEPCWGYSRDAVRDPCPGTPDFYAIYRALQRAPEADIEKISTQLRRAHAGEQHPGPRHRKAMLRDQGRCIPYIAKAIMGGGDCKNSKYPDFPDYFRALVAEYGYPGEDVLEPGEGDPTQTEPTEPGPWTPEPGDPGTGPIYPGGPGTGPAPAGGGRAVGALLAGGVALLLVPRLLGR